MNQVLININDSWEVIKNRLSELPDEIDFSNLDYSEEDLLWIKREDYNIDLGIYGIVPFFGLYLYKGSDWHDCQLLEKRKFKSYKLLINCINEFIQNIEIGVYNDISSKQGSIDEFCDDDFVSVLKK